VTQSVAFLDTNILVYAIGDDAKAALARQLMERGFVGSVQSLNEFSNVTRKRFGWSWEQIGTATASIRTLAGKVVPTEVDDHVLSLDLAARYRLSVFDALMLAIALRAQCAVFYSEDMHHGLVIEDRMTILNPFA
jgi:predicted nucleic acid-binding protein